jgi:very-short-patch-repair endonuclease
LALGGINGARLRRLIDQAEIASHDQRALFLRLQPETSVEGYVEQTIALLAETARRLWPVWFSNVSFAACDAGTLGKLAAGAIVREATARVRGLNAAWTEAGTRLALDGRAPRVNGVPPAVELSQLVLAIGGSRLALIVDADEAMTDVHHAPALMHALEWIAQHSGASVVILFPELPAFGSPFDRVLYGARRATDEAHADAPIVEPPYPDSAENASWFAPWRGAPHPMSEIEQRLAALLDADGELSRLFHFNWLIETVRGSRAKVDLVWLDGRLVVELDGYDDHSTRGAFIGDRRRDYELALTGYTVLRLANDEIVQDFGRAVEKIRDLVRLRRSQMRQEA